MGKITDLILDFDGTCTQIPCIYANFLDQYRQGVNATLTLTQQITDDLWERGIAEVRRQSPAAGWTLGTTPSAPAAGDPYMLSGEVVKYIFRTTRPQPITTPVPTSLFATVYAGNPAPWRVETLEVIKALLAKDVSIHFVSNSDASGITHRFQDLWGGEKIPATVQIHGSASKYNINEPNWEDLASWSDELTNAYCRLPAVQSNIDIRRPLYLRRGNFFSVIASIFKDHPARLATSVFCGDVWELDLALPAHLGANIHLIERASPFDTYDYERQLTLERGDKGKISQDLWGLLDWD